ncbi:MAG: DUF4351 domain-containing protein [Chloroflexi bacterium]|nr:DUF4351 domain-containing protein [Chloroflexota bacterium]
MTILRESPWYNELIKEGIEQGIERGIEQGIERGKEQMLLHLLSHKFGELDSAWIARIEDIPAEQLEEVFVLALDSSTLQELAAHLDNLSSPAR